MKQVSCRKINLSHILRFITEHNFTKSLYSTAFEAILFTMPNRNTDELISINTIT